MSTRKRPPDGVDRPAEMSAEDLTAEQATELPDREAMSIIAVGDNVAMPINEANALNFYSNYSVAVADADQVVIVDQTNVEGTGAAGPASSVTDAVVRGNSGNSGNKGGS